MKALLPSVFAALVLYAGLPALASASDGWCDTDPVLIIKTPAGSLVPVYVDTGARGVEHLPAAQIAEITYTDSPAAHGAATRVNVTVVVPPDAFGSSFETRSGVSSGPFQTGTVYATSGGTSSAAMNLQFVLPER